VKQQLLEEEVKTLKAEVEDLKKEVSFLKSRLKDKEYDC